MDRLENALEHTCNQIYECLLEGMTSEADDMHGGVSCIKAAIMRHLIRLVDDAKIKPQNSLNIAEFVSYWLSYQYS